MKFNPLSFQPLAFTSANCYAPDPARVLETLKRLEPLVPEIASHELDSLSVYALKYVERYQDDVLQLGMGWEVLYAALAYAWERKTILPPFPWLQEWRGPLAVSARWQKLNISCKWALKRAVAHRIMNTASLS